MSAMEPIVSPFQPGELVVLESGPERVVSIAIVCQSDEHVTFVEHLDGRLRGQVAVARTSRLRPVLRREVVPAGG